MYLRLWARTARVYAVLEEQVILLRRPAAAQETGIAAADAFRVRLGLDAESVEQSREEAVRCDHCRSFRSRSGRARLIPDQGMQIDSSYMLSGIVPSPLPRTP